MNTAAAQEKLPKILIIIPAYNEQENILGVVRNLEKTCPFVDYVIVNDGSTDDTLRVLRDEGLSYINLPANLGIGGGVQTGYLYAYEQGYDIAIQLDGDGQHNPEYILKLVEPLMKNEADMTIGSRFIEKDGFQSTSLRRVGIRMIGATIRMCGKTRITDATSGFRACNKALIKYFSAHYAQDYPEPEAIIAALRNGYKVSEIPVTMNERAGGASSISGLKSVYYMCKVELALLVQAIHERDI